MIVRGHPSNAIQTTTLAGIAALLLVVGCASPSKLETTPDGRTILERSDAPIAEATGESGRPSAESGSPERKARETGDGEEEPSATSESESTESATKSPDEAETSDDEKKDDADKNKSPGRIVLKTEYDDRRVGKDQASLVEAELGLLRDEELTRYVRSVAARLMRHAPPRPFDYEFSIVDQNAPNAFALPGGKIYVSRGLLALVTSEDELAGVLGHEIIHAAERHASARIDYSRRINPFSIGFLRAAAIAAYGRDQERDADRGGQILAAKAGYDPRGIGTFLRKLDAAERYEIGWSRLPSFLATHPTSPERAALASDRATSLDWERVPAVAAERPRGYYDLVDGLVLGDDPAGGLFDEENLFVHPNLGFSIQFPRGWTTMNGQQAVRALAPGRDAQAELTVEGNADEDMNEIIDRFIEREFDGLRVRTKGRQEIRVGEDGEVAIRIEGRVSSTLGGALTFQMTFVRHGDLVFRLSLLTVSGAEGKYRGRGLSFVRSFRELDDAGTYSLEVVRLRVARALENETLEALSKRTRNALELVYTGVLNGVYASTTLEPRRMIKIGIAEPYIPPPAEEEEASEDEAPLDAR